MWKFQHFQVTLVSQQGIWHTSDNVLSAIKVFLSDKFIHVEISTLSTNSSLTTRNLAYMW